MKLKQVELKKVLITAEYKSKIDGATDKQINFVNEVLDKVFNPMDGNIYINHNRCGIGKSTLIKATLNHLVNDSTYWGIANRDKLLEDDGAIVVTDKLDRLEEIATYPGLEDRCYFMKYDKDDESTYKSNRIDFLEQLKEQFKYPIVLVSTQKYFKMTETERKQLYKWKNGDRKIKLIDEKPYLISTTVIDEAYLSTIGIALEALPKSEEKEGILKYWRDIYNFIDTLRHSYQKYDINWISGNGSSAIINSALDKKFMKAIENDVTTNIYEMIEKLKDINKKGCLFVSSSGKLVDNSRQLIIIDNNFEKFDIDKCKNIIFDATAEVDADYLTIPKEHKKMFKAEDSKESDIDLHHVVVSASQNSLINKNNNIETLSKYINSITETGLVITHGKKRGIYNKFNKHLNTKNHAYFGDVKGKNDWEGLSEMVQVGMNRKTNSVYLITYIAYTQINEKWNKINDTDKIHNEIKQILEVDKGLFLNETMKTIMKSDLVVDSIQNLMRVKCRHFSNNEKCKIFFVCNRYLIDTVNEIAKLVNAKVTRVVPDIFEEEKMMNRKANEGKKKTNPQILMEFLKGLDNGRIITTKEIYNESGLSKTQFDKAKKDNKILKKWFIEHKGNKRGEFIA